MEEGSSSGARRRAELIVVLIVFVMMGRARKGGEALRLIGKPTMRGLHCRRRHWLQVNFLYFCLYSAERI